MYKQTVSAVRIQKVLAVTSTFRRILIVIELKPFGATFVFGLCRLRHFLHRDRWRMCSQIDEPPHATHQGRT